MAIRPSVPEIITVNSEELQTQIRDLLPSQAGFGSELQATNVITPIIDLTRTAEGSGLPAYLQTALAFGSQTAFKVSGTSSVILNSPGFYRVYGTISIRPASGVAIDGGFDMSDGLSTKTIFELVAGTNLNEADTNTQYDFVVFLRPGDSLTAVSSNGQCTNTGTTRQVATGDGTLVQPNGYPL